MVATHADVISNTSLSNRVAPKTRASMTEFIFVINIVCFATPNHLGRITLPRFCLRNPYIFVLTSRLRLRAWGKTKLAKRLYEFQFFEMNMEDLCLVDEGKIIRQRARKF